MSVVTPGDRDDRYTRAERERWRDAEYLNPDRYGPNPDLKSVPRAWMKG